MEPMRTPLKSAAIVEEAEPTVSRLPGEATPTPTLPEAFTTNGVESVKVPSSLTRRARPVPAVATSSAAPELAA